MAIHFTAALFAVLVVIGNVLFREPVAVFGESGESFPLVTDTGESALVMTPIDHRKTILNYDFPYLSGLVTPEETPYKPLQSSKTIEVQQLKLAS